MPDYTASSIELRLISWTAQYLDSLLCEEQKSESKERHGVSIALTGEDDGGVVKPVRIRWHAGCRCRAELVRLMGALFRGPGTRQNN